MKRILVFISLIIMVWFLISCEDNPTIIPSPTVAETVLPTPTATETVLPTPTPSPTVEPTPEPTPEPSPSATVEPTEVIEPTPTAITEPTPEPTPSIVTGTISAFLNSGELMYIEGVITHMGPYNTFGLQDLTGAVSLRIEGKNSSNIGFVVGDKVKVLVEKTEYDGLIQAEVIDEVIELISSDNPLPEIIDLSNQSLTRTNLIKYQSHIVKIDDIEVIDKVIDQHNNIIITGKNYANQEITIKYDSRYDIGDTSKLESIKIGDFIHLEGLLLSWSDYPLLMIGNTDEVTIEEVSSEQGDEKNFNIFYLNDTHGAVLKDKSELGLAYIGNYIKQTKNENSIFLTGGDIFQGQLISNSNKGALMVEIFNELELDAFTIGNHEFDWGLDVILQYFDPSTEGVKANFPLLGANVILKETNERPEFIDSHTIIERDGKKIGIIGVIGDGLETSISTPRVKDYKFTDAYLAVEETVNLIKDEVDFIIVVNHHNSQTFNNKVSNLTKVSAIFNGHSHTESINFIDKIPVVQSRHNGFMVGRVHLEFVVNRNRLELEQSTAANIKTHSAFNVADQTIENIIASYYEDIYPLYEEVMLTASRSMSQNDLAYFISRLMKEASESDAGFQNSGGTRSSISYNQDITAADIYQITPFENQIIVVEVGGFVFNQLLNDDYFYITSDYTPNQVSNNQTYKIATNDYVFYNTYNEWLFGEYYDQEVLFGDVYETFYQVLLNLKALGHTTFDTDSPIIFNTGNLFNETIVFIVPNQVLFNDKRYFLS